MAHARNRPKLLHEKLRLIREHLNINQASMAEQLVSEIESHSQRRIGVDPSGISKFERGKRVPDLVIMMGYARNRPDLLPEKLRLIREHLRLDHAQMAEQLVSEIESHSKKEYSD